MSESMRTAVVSIEGDAEAVSFPALIAGSRWNGWAVPYFARAAVDAMLPVFLDDDGAPVLRWSGVAGTTLLLVDDDGDSRVWLEVPPVWVDGVCYWGVGAGGWVWLEVDADSDVAL